MAAESSSGPTPASSSPWRRALKTSISALLVEAGYHSADIMALETLVELAQAYIWEAGRSSSSYAELAGRTHVMPSDCVMALIEMGQDLTTLPGHARRDFKTTFLPPQPAPAVPQSKILQVGDKKKHPPHIPDHLPPFPDTHTYIKTPCFKQPSNEYQVVREKAASQKRDVEVALTRFIAKTGPTHSLFRDDKSAFPLIACKPTPIPFLSALLPMDYEALPQENTSEQESSGKQKQGFAESSVRAADDRPKDDVNNGADSVQEGETIDNPYLLPAKIARKKWR